MKINMIPKSIIDEVAKEYAAMITRSQFRMQNSNSVVKFDWQAIFTDIIYETYYRALYANGKKLK